MTRRRNSKQRLYEKGSVPSNHLVSIFISLVIIALAFSVGYYTGTRESSDIEHIDSLSNKLQGMPASVNFAPYWRAWNVIEEKYVPVAGENHNGTSTEGSITSTQKKVWGSIQGLASSLDDPYTLFLPPQESKTFEEDISGQFEGVGIRINVIGGVLTVISPLDGTPAMKAGIQPQDRIIEINGESTQGMTVNEAVKRIRGKGGTTVTFTIVREDEDEPLTIPVTRDDIQIPTITKRYREADDIFVIKLHNFSEKSPLLFRQAVREFVATKSNNLILDLRQNPGGFLAAAVDMASYFLPEGEVIVREDFGKKQDARVYRSKGHTINRPNLNMIVLVDGGSASASEILAGALSEHGVATLLGSKTFGKGSVQELVPITDDPKTSLKVTVARWLTPEGTSISLQGITPDVEVERTAAQYQAGEDPQLDRAIEMLRVR